MPNDKSASETVSLVVPAFNEGNNLSEFIRRAEALGGTLAEVGIVTEIVIVDDHSGDDTRQIMHELLRTRTHLKYIRLSRNSGSHSAVAAGLLYCTGDCAVIMAADLQDPPEAIPGLLECWHAGHDVVWACRSTRLGESLATKLSSILFHKTMQLFAMPQMPSKGADFLLISRNVVDAFNAIPEKHTNCLALILWMGFRQTSVEYVKHARNEGKSKWTLRKKIKLFVDSVVSFSYVPIRFMSFFGMLMAFSGFLYGAVVIFGRLAGFVRAGTGFAALMTVLLVGQGCILLMLGVLGEYLWRTFDEARGRPRFIVEEVIASRVEAGPARVKEEKQ